MNIYILLFSLAIVTDVYSVTWRGIVHKVSQCSLDKTSIPLSGLKLTRLDENVSNLTAGFSLPQDVYFKKVEISMFQSSSAGSKIKVLSFTYYNVCQALEKPNKYVDFIFESGDLPRDCNYKKGEYFSNRINLNFTMDYDGYFPQGFYEAQSKVYMRNGKTLCIQVSVECKPERRSKIGIPCNNCKPERRSKVGIP